MFTGVWKNSSRSLLDIRTRGGGERGGRGAAEAGGNEVLRACYNDGDGAEAGTGDISSQGDGAAATGRQWRPLFRGQTQRSRMSINLIKKCGF